MKFLRGAFVFSFATMLCGLAACVADEPSPAGGDDTANGDASTDGNNGGDSTIGSDGSTGDSATADSGPKRFCATQSPPVDSADYFCADFDGTGMTEGFPDGSVFVTDGSTLTLSSDVAFSLPNGLSSQILNDENATAYLQWHKSGATSLKTISLSVEVNPGTSLLFPGSTELFGIPLVDSFGKNEAYFGYSSAGTTTKDGSTNYTGYYLEVIYDNGTLFEYVSLPDIPQGNWTQVTLARDLTTGAVTVSYAGIVKGSDTTSSLTTTNAVVRLGNQGDFTNQTTTAWGYDNLVVSTTRN